MKTKHSSFLKLSTVLLIFLAVILLLIPFEIRSQLEDNVRLFKGQEHSFQLNSPFHVYIRADKEGMLGINGTALGNESFRRLGYEGDLLLKGLEKGEVKLEFSLFGGLIPLRELSVNVLPEIEVMPGGHSIGIKLHEKGVFVVDYYYIEREGEYFSPAEEQGIKIGDLITAINGQEVSDIDEAAQVIKKESSKGTMVFTVKRKGEERLEKVKEAVTPYYCSQAEEFRIGLYIRDTAAGVGTLTFYDQENKYFGALGHIITDVDTNTALKIEEGLIVRADVINIRAARRGQPGEKAGVFRQGRDILGTIDKNTEYGIFGQLNEISSASTPFPYPVPLALSFEVETGPAELLTVIEGSKIQSFELKIEEINHQNAPGDKGMVIRIVDEKLLQKTGGIVQGMSGSPILQNGKLVGAVTHVFVNDPSRGYGIFAEWMLNETEILLY